MSCSMLWSTDDLIRFPADFKAWQWKKPDERHYAVQDSDFLAEDAATGLTILLQPMPAAFSLYPSYPRTA